MRRAGDVDSLFDVGQRTRAEWLADLESNDESRVISALHCACPCTGSRELFDEYMPALARFKHDPRPAVRLVALHLEVDALQHLAIEDERAGGFTRNGRDRRRGSELRRADLRHGFRAS